MKAIFEFNLPEQNEEYLLYHHAPEIDSVLRDIIRYLEAVRDNEKPPSGTIVADEILRIINDSGYSL